MNPYFDVAEKGISEMVFDMSRWIKTIEGLSDNPLGKQTFDSQFTELLKDEDTLRGVLETCINMKTISPEMRS
jgi:hypothetical protein